MNWAGTQGKVVRAAPTPRHAPEKPLPIGRIALMGESDVAVGAFGTNAWLVDEMFEQYQKDPSSVSQSWQEFFADYRPASRSSAAEPSSQPEPEAKSEAAPGIVDSSEGTPLRGAAALIAANMEASLSVPTATSVRAVPGRLLEVNRSILNNQLPRSSGGKVSFTRLIGYAVVQAMMAVPAMRSVFQRQPDGKPMVVRH